MVRVLRVVLTGGPCGGKSSALPRIATSVRQLGCPCVVLTEMATSLVEAGVDRTGMIQSQAGLYAFNRWYLRMQVARESQMAALASDMATHSPARHNLVVLLCDRGTMDCKPFVPRPVWERLMCDYGSSTEAAEERLCERSYDLVLHFVTAADGAPQAYSLDNIARTESPQQARANDTKMWSVWSSRHPKAVRLENDVRGEGKAALIDSFERKLAQATQAVVAEVEAMSRLSSL